MKQTNPEIIKIKRWFFDKIRIINKPLYELIRVKKNTDIRNNRHDICMKNFVSMPLAADRVSLLTLVSPCFGCPGFSPSACSAAQSQTQLLGNTLPSLQCKQTTKLCVTLMTQVQTFFFQGRSWHSYTRRGPNRRSALSIVLSSVPSSGACMCGLPRSL